MSIQCLHQPQYPIKHFKQNDDNSNESHQVPMMLFTRVNDTYSSKQNLRIIQRNLVYLIGLSTEIANKNLSLLAFEYLGQYGNVVKLVVNKNKTYNTNGPNGPSYSCHATYSSIDESSLAILCLDNVVVDNHVLKASYGTTKYCSNFLRNSQCLNKDCLYLHALADDRDIISREQMNDKNLFANQHLMAIELSNILNQTRRRLIEKLKDRLTVFPNVAQVYSKDVVINYQQSKQAVKDRKSKQHITILGLDRIYQSKDRSRFDFAKDAGESKFLIQVPDNVTNFLKVNFKKSILLKKEQENVSQYYFSQKKANEAEDSWASLLTTLDLFTAFDSSNHCVSTIKRIEENNSIVLVDKFNSV